MPELDLNLIPYLVAMEETRNVSRAADRLGVSQPRVSTALGKLREYFGDQLFVRLAGVEEAAVLLVPALLEQDFRELVGRKKSGFDGRERDWWVKTPTHVLRLAGTMAYLDWAMESVGTTIRTMPSTRRKAALLPIMRGDPLPSSSSLSSATCADFAYAISKAALSLAGGSVSTRPGCAVISLLLSFKPC